MQTPLHRVGLFSLGLASLVAVSAMLVGCEGVAAVAYAVRGGEPVKKVYALPPVMTLVLVDTIEGPDRVNVLANPTYRSIIASDIAYHLEREKGLPPGLIVSQRDLNQLAAELGQNFARTPIDQIGRRLGAKQVLHITVEQSTVSVGGSLYRPLATGQVKVIDVEAGRRIIPRALDLDPEGGVPGHRFSVEMEPVSTDTADRGITDQLSRALAQRVALDTGRLFFDWKKDDLGSKIK